MNVLLLQVMLKRDPEWCMSEIAAIHRAIRKPLHRAMHTSRNLAFVIKTDETSQELVERLAGVLGATAIEDSWCYTASRDIVSSRSGLDSLTMRVRAAYAEIQNRRYPKNVRYIEGPGRKRQFASKQGVGDTSIKMGTVKPRERQPPRNTDRPNRHTRHVDPPKRGS